MQTYLKAVKSKSLSARFHEEIDLSKILNWLPRGLSLFLVITWLIVVLLYGFEQYFAAGVMVWLILALTAAISWKNAPIGGGIFVILGSVYLVFAMNSSFSIEIVLGAIPLFIVGALFIFNYLYTEKKEQEEEGVDDF